MILLIDNYDSFTYNLVDLLLQHKVELKVIRNDALTLNEIIALQPEALVISPGPGRPEKAGILMEIIKEYATKIPILGICLGHQALGLHFGANLVHATKCMHGKVSTLQHVQHPMFANIEQGAEMMRYHSLILENLPDSLNVVASSLQEEIMAFAHHQLPIWAVQFHPESVLSTNGPQIIRNWLTHFQLIKHFDAFC